MNRRVNTLAVRALAGLAFAATVVGASVLPATASAETFSLRHAHVRESHDASGYRRLGVAMMTMPDGRQEPATLDLRGVLTGAQGDGWFGMRAQLSYRFLDGSTIEGRMEGRFRRSDVGDIAGAQEGAGELTGGSGRFHGIEGRFTFKGEGGLSTLVPGVLADVYGDLSGEYRLRPR